MEVEHARHLVSQITQNDDGAHAQQLLMLIHGIADPKSEAATEVQKMLYAMTSDFSTHFNAYVGSLAA